MRTVRRAAFLALFLFLEIGHSVGQTNPAEQRARELLELIGSGDRGAARVYIEKNYEPSFLTQFPMEAHVGFVSRMHDRTRGLDIQGIRTARPNQVTVTVKSRLTDEVEEITVAVEPDPPHRIASIEGRRLPPTDPVHRGKLTDSDMATELDAYARKLHAADVFSGSILLARNGHVIYRDAFGLANKDFGAPNKPDTKFNLGSMNKMFTAVAIAQLVERGKLSFDDPLSRFLPDFPDAESAAKIKIRHLLTHTSGLGSYFNEEFRMGSRARFRTVDEMMKLAKNERPAFEPGSRWRYSNTGFLVLGAVIEAVTGQSYHDFVRANIAAPAGMTNTDCYELDQVNSNLAVGYSKEFTDDGIRFRNNVFEHVIKGGPAGGGYSTVDDLHKFALALTGNRLLRREYVNMLVTGKPDLNSPDYGYGFSVNSETRSVGHGGGFPGISSNLAIYLDDGYVSVVLSNYSAASQSITRKIDELVISARASN